MKIKNVLKQLRKADENTLSEIQNKYSADWEMDELFDKSYEKYISKKNFEEADNDSITFEYHAEKRNSSVIILHRIIPAAACFALIAFSTGYIYTHSSNNKTENQDVYNNNVITTFEKYNEEKSITSKYTDTIASEERITDVYTVTEYVDQTAELMISTSKTSDLVTSFKNNDSVNKTENAKVSEAHQDTVKHTDKTVPRTTSVISVKTDNPETEIANTGTMPVTTIPVKPQTSETIGSTTVKPSEKRRISVEDIFSLSYKGDALDWSDFSDYEYTDIGSGLFVYEYKLKESELKDYVLRIGGVPEQKPYYIWLVPVNYGYGSNRYCNIISDTEEDIKAFLNYYPDSDETEDLEKKAIESYVRKYKYESAEFDIDNDGITEQCVISYGPTSGISTHIISVYADGELKYRNTFSLDTRKLSFVVIKEAAYVRMLKHKDMTNEEYTEDHKIYTEGKKIIIEDMDPVYEWYWGDAEYNLDFD